MEDYKKKYIEDLNAIIRNCEILKSHCRNLIEEVDNEDFFEPLVFYDWVARKNINSTFYQINIIEYYAYKAHDNRNYMVNHYGLYKKD